jgi:DNA helicase IV
LTGNPSEIAREQAYVDRLYARLDALRARTTAELAAVRRTGASGTAQDRSERDAFATFHEDRLAQLEAVEDRLCFGRLDLVDAPPRYVGRIGLADDRQAQLLVDWRAPAARTFYQATAANPQGVARRRHLVTKGREVVGLEDEVLDLSGLSERDSVALTGEGALLAALSEHRTGRMRDIVATIQAEQDRVIRADLPGVMVVQGGPGTGKTAVALHRAAYLLYTHRDRLARSGVLLVGPNPTFLRYIEQVLPSLGETGVVMATPGQLYPGVDARGTEAPEVAALKGDLRMTRVVAAAVRARQRVPDRPVRLDVEGHRLVVRPHVVSAARDRARRGRRPHNAARTRFLLDLLDDLVRQFAASLGTTVSADNRDELLVGLHESRDVRRELNLLWMPLTPQRLIEDLYADPERLAEAAGSRLSAAEQRLLLRERTSAWTPADVPLLDEAAELLGDDETGTHAAAQAEQARQADLSYAREVLAMRGDDDGLVSAEALAARFEDTGPRTDTAARAAQDREWAYGHVVVDEAQELSPMAWRVLIRRCPMKSMTVVGDVAQTGSLAGAHSWGSVLAPYVQDRWRLEELTVNYRTPRQVMEIATAVLAAGAPDAAESAPTSARDAQVPPRAARIGAGLLSSGEDLSDALAGVRAAVAAELDLLGEGRLAVVATAEVAARVAGPLAAALPPGVVGLGPDSLDHPVAVLAVEQVKGLEFDAVVLLEPAAIVAASPRGVNDLYVALTRPTQRLVVLHSEPLPPGMGAVGPSGRGSA